MTLSPLFSFAHNPIARAEYRHQRFIITNSRSGIGWILLAVAMLAPAFISSLIYFFTALFGIHVNVFSEIRYASLPEQFLSIGTLFMVTMNIALYLVVILITVGLASNSIGREKRSRTWDTLLLTNIDARKIVMGKWWASLRAIWGDHMMILFLRLGLIGFIIHVFQPIAPQGLTVVLAYILPLSCFAVLFTIVDAMFTAALGIAIPLSEWSGAVVGGIVLNVKLATIIGSGALAYATVLDIHYSHDMGYITLLSGALVAYIFLTWGTLRVAQYIAVRGQVSAPDSE